MKVLETDYDNYAFLLFSRDRFYFDKSSWGVILTRRSNIAPEELEFLISKFEDDYE